VGDSQNTYFDINQDVPLVGGDETKDVDMDMEDANTSEMEPSTDLSQEGLSPFYPRTACRESAQSSSVCSFPVQVRFP